MGDDRTVTRQAERGGAAEANTALLTAVYPPGLEWRVELPDQVVEIGRQKGTGGMPALEHPTVSRAHLSLRPDPETGLHRVRDLGSHNGSRLGGVTLSADDEMGLSDGAVVQIGDVLMIYELAGDVVADAVAEAAVDRETIPGRAVEISRIRGHIARAAADPAPLLLIGETGTGKEWIAREAHRLSGRGGDLVAVNCAALSPQLVESQLFGHVRGAFTGATADQRGFFRAADGGTLLLDEIGELPAELQPKLLRVLQEREVRPVGSTEAMPVDVRVIAATNRDLALMVNAGTFRRDLYARLALWEIELPPLRRRRVDVLDWVDRLHRRWREQRGGQARSSAALELSPDAAAALVLHPWPENLRGVERLVHTLAPLERRIVHSDLPGWITDPPTAHRPAAAESPEPRPTRSIPGAEEFAAALEELDGNISAMAKRFGRDRRQIYRWIESYGLAQRRQELLDK
jgi:transcriptional regulator with PAS, ATPase and Fis domain